MSSKESAWHCLEAQHRPATERLSKAPELGVLFQLLWHVARVSGNTTPVTGTQCSILGTYREEFRVQKNTTSPKPPQKECFLGTAVDVPGFHVGEFEVSFLVALTGLRFLILSETFLYN